ncbi:hypothetical protein [Mycoplasmopsis felifaucium]|uniref:Uncharacterized protein n=1 Tax=Mycoplasmopsis felifaucium TaxID=35768 RepID=A0ABZ2RXW6_9BACT
MKPENKAEVDQSITRLEEINEIKILNEDDINTLSDKQRKLLLEDAESHLTDEEWRKKYLANKRKIIWTTIITSIVFTGLITLLIVMILMITKAI